MMRLLAGACSAAAAKKNSRATALQKTCRGLRSAPLSYVAACRRGGGVTSAGRPSSQDLDRSPGRQQQQHAAVGSDLLVVLDLTADVIILPPLDDKNFSAAPAFLSPSAAC